MQKHCIVLNIFDDILQLVDVLGGDYMHIPTLAPNLSWTTSLFL